MSTTADEMTATSTRLEFTIPGTPMAWARARTNGTRHFTADSQLAYKRAVALLGAQAMAGRAPFTGPVVLALVAVFEPPASWSKARREAALAGEALPQSKPDWDNLGKITSDALNGIAYKDDAQVVDGRVLKRFGSRARVEVAVVGTRS